MPDRKGGSSTLDKKAHKHYRDGLEALLRYIAGNAELRGTRAFKEFLSPDELSGSLNDTGSEVVSLVPRPVIRLLLDLVVYLVPRPLHEVVIRLILDLKW